jgi:glycosyltransferase involved in cell wall biosynthesis
MISVITPVYNGEKFIENCINNVLAQECHEVEHIIVDGGSNDGTAEIVAKYIKLFPHIQWISEPDKGQSDAMNKGIKKARGEVIAILNVDDRYEPGVLNRILEIFIDLPNPSFIVGNCRILNDQNQLIAMNRPARLTLPDLLKGWHVNPFPYNPSAYFYHSSIHDYVGLYDISDHYSMDVDFILRAVKVAHTKYFDEIWGNFYLHEDCKTGQASAPERAARVNAIMRRYRQDLPLPEYLWITFIYEYFANPYLMYLKRLFKPLKKIAKNLL